ncbi:PKD domain-containing protein [Patescibacteria group bacterium]|nr:PKD domain-containing protein [Patescibacteria group bacterium]MDE1946573.1 PKD domain-containing protein [Patescibacteria group bacterium]MDE2010866.1 PKD domain-containing protein [Patescibacteria group bacterium]MDE2232750.1 PKD domain-containing protein [Patescibacteria group bacterium]
MKNKITKNTPGKFSALLLVISAAITLMPSLASANYYGIGDRYGYNNYQSTVYTYTPQPIYYPQPTPVYVPQPVYYSQPVVQPVYYPVYQSLSVSCGPSTYSVNAGNSVTWTAYASGGNGYYSYNWSGTDGLYGSDSSISKYYYDGGIKYASVTVYSNGQSVTQNCGNTVTVYGNYYAANYPVYYQQQTPVVVQSTPVVVQQSPTYSVTPNTVIASGLDIGCYADPTSITTNQPTTWTAEVTGGMAPYTYSWTGSDGLTGSQSSVTKYYSVSGDKSAIVSVTSADGKTGTRACSNSIAVRSTASIYAAAPRATYTAPVSQASSQQPAAGNNIPANAQYSAASLFSLSNVPWGWVAVLIILVLFATVMYLLFNRKKI